MVRQRWTGPGLNTAWDCVAQRGEYNTYTLEWTATRLEIKVNGTTCLVNTSGDPAFQKPYIVALTQLMVFVEMSTPEWRRCPRR